MKINTEISIRRIIIILAIILSPFIALVVVVQIWLWIDDDFLYSPNLETLAEKKVLSDIKEKLHDPGSFEHISTTFIDFFAYKTQMKRLEADKNALENLRILEESRLYSDIIPRIVVIKYRAKNAFGALMLTETIAVYRRGILGEFVFLLNHLEE